MRCLRQMLPGSLLLAVSCVNGGATTKASEPASDHEDSQPSRANEETSFGEKPKQHESKAELSQTTANEAQGLPGSSSSEPVVTEISFAPDYSALLYVPPGSERLPGWIVTHGAGGRAESHLRYWAELLEDKFVIFSIEGTALSSKEPDGGYYYKSHIALEKEVLALIEHLRHSEQESQPYARRLAPGPFSYAGYSQGATMGALFLVEHGQLFQRLVLIEGGTQGWTYSRAQTFADAGGRSVLWVCGTAGCQSGAHKASDTAKRAGLTTRVEMVQGAGHAYWGPVRTRVESALPWVLGQL